eukprot:TRINITY_DN53952_c0_g1_i1.p1 TRINITY_DN53952_c0_g1~~TRINITY_DN53952_c0_g1_i1.p1  ORF type:complete len:998 (-),score=238.52 TRINITY_DN53952_c0_g1_i1:80-3073(-)
MYQSTFDLVKPTLVAASDSFVTVLSELGSELLLTFLFCLGFALFRVSNIRSLFERTPIVIHDYASKAAAFDGPPSPVSRRSSDASADGEPRKMAREASDKSIQGYVFGAARSAAASFGGLTWVADVPDMVRHTLSAPSAPGRKVSSPAAVGVTARGPQQPQQQAARSRAGSAAAQAFVQRIRSAMQAGDAEAAERGIIAMTQAGHIPAPGCIVAFLRLLRSISGSNGSAAARALRRLPMAALPAPVLAAVCDEASRSGDLAILKEVLALARPLGLASAPSAVESLLRGLAAAGDAAATREAFEELVEGSSGSALLSETSLAAIANACAESRLSWLAERCAQHARRAQGKLGLPMYAALLKVYAASKQFSQACDLYDTMREDGVKPDTVAYGCLIRAAVECGRLGLARDLFEESGNPDLLNCMSLIRAAGREKDVPKALRLLEALERSPATVDAAAYNCTLEACAACGDRANGEKLLRHMEGLGLTDVVSYNTYAKLLSGAAGETEELLRSMRQRGVDPNVVTYNTLAKAAANRQDLRAAWRLVAEMESHGVTPDSFTCSILLKGMKHAAPSAADVDRVVGLVRRAGIEPDEVLVSCLLDACVKLRDGERLAQVLDEFKTTGTVPSPRAAAMLLRAHGHAKRMDRAWALWRDLTRGPRALEDVGEEVFASMLEACLSAADLPGAASLWRQLTHRCGAFQRSPALFANTVKALVQARRSKLAMDLYNDVKDAFPCTKVTYNTLIDAHVRADKMSVALELFREMSLYGSTPDLISYSTLIRGHCSRGDLEQGLQMLGQMQRRGITPDAVLFNSILDGCAHKQMRTLTEQVLKDMDKAGVAPSNFTISILVKLYGRCGDVAAAFAAVEDYPRRFGFEVNTQVYTCLMSACISNGELSRALEVYATIKQRGLYCDAKTFHTLLNGCVRAGDLPAAVRVVRDALQSSQQNGGQPALDREAVESVLLMAVRLGEAATVAAPLLQETQVAGISVSDRVISVVMRS